MLLHQVGPTEQTQCHRQQFPVGSLCFNWPADDQMICGTRLAGDDEQVLGNSRVSGQAWQSWSLSRVPANMQSAGQLYEKSQCQALCTASRCGLPSSKTPCRVEWPEVPHRYYCGHPTTSCIAGKAESKLIRKSVRQARHHALKA